MPNCRVALENSSRRTARTCLQFYPDYCDCGVQTEGLAATVFPNFVDNEEVPFTVSHAAAALPFRRARLVTSALVVGTMAPDSSTFWLSRPTTSSDTRSPAFWS